MLVIIAIISITVLIFFILVYFKFGLGGNKGLKDGMRLEAQGKYHEALASYDYALNKGIATPELRWKIANIALKLNLIPRAQKELNILISTNQYPKNVSEATVKSLLASCFIKSGNEKQAFIELLEILNKGENYQAYFEIGKIYVSQGKTQKGIQYIEKYINSNPSDGEAYYILGKASLDMGDANKALDYFEKALRLHYNDEGYLKYFLGVLYYSQKKYQIALHNLTQVIKESSLNNLKADAHRIIGLCYKEKGLIDEAITNLESSVKYSSEDGKILNKESLYNQGVLLYKKGKYQTALEQFQKIYLIDPKYKDIQKIIPAIQSKIKGIPTDYSINFSEENPLNNILKKGLLLSKVRFDIDKIENEILKKVSSNTQVTKKGQQSKSTSESSSYTIEKINEMEPKDFKEIARKLVTVLGFDIKAEPKFQGDTEYIDGNAINFLVVPVSSNSKGKEILFTIRRYKEEVSELSVGNFLDWLDEKQIKQGIFIASESYSKQAMSLIEKCNNVKFIDKNGLAKMLGRIK